MGHDAVPVATVANTSTHNVMGMAKPSCQWLGICRPRRHEDDVVRGQADVAAVGPSYYEQRRALQQGRHGDEVPAAEWVHLDTTLDATYQQSLFAHLLHLQNQLRKLDMVERYIKRYTLRNSL